MKKRLNRLSTQSIVVGLFIIFTVPFGVVVQGFVAEIDTRLEFAAKERQGLRYINALRGLLGQLLEHQQLTEIYQANQTQAQAVLRQSILSQNVSIDIAIEQVDGVDQALGETLNTTSPWTGIKAHWQQFKQGQFARSPETNRVLNDFLVSDVLALISHVSDQSNLILDPDLDSYYLMDAVVTQLPSLLRSSAQLRTLGGIMALEQPQENLRDQVLGLESSMQAPLKAIDRGTRVAFDYNPTLFSQLKAPVLDVAFYTNTFLELVDGMTFRKSVNPQDFTVLGNRAIAIQFKLYDAMAVALDQLLQNRIAKFARRQQQVQLFGLFTLLTLIAILIAFMLNSERRHQSESANQSKTVYLSNMSHELRTPLNIILGFTQLMIRDRSLTAKQQEQLSTINRSGEHLLTLINDVLEMSKIEAGRVTLNESDFDLHHLLDWLFQMFQFKTQSRGLQFAVERADNLPQYIRTDESKLRQVLINLLSNAVKFTERGSVMLRVKGPEQDAKNRSQFPIRFEVEDTGSGISAGELQQLFQPFVQTEVGHKSQEGTGLGLVISQKFVNLMQGEITVSSRAGSGSQFRFTIPVQVMETAASPDVTSRQVVGLAAGQPTYRILAVDDKPENRRILVELLVPVGFEVQEAEDGKAAIAQWETWNPDLIWMDVRMPVINGYEATQQIKRACASGNRAAPVIIALTGSVFEEDRKLALEKGCNDFVRKPFRVEELFEKMAEHLGVQYVYAEPDLIAIAQARSENTHRSATLTAADLTDLPIDWVEQLHQAATKVNSKLVLELVEQISPTHAHLATALNQLVDDFCFEEIVELSEQCLKNAASL